MDKTRTSLSLRILCLLLALALLLAGCGDRGGANASVGQEGAASGPEEEHVSPDKTKSGSEAGPEEDPDRYVEHGDFLWMVQQGDSTVYLMGTMHVLRDDYRLNDRVLELFYASDALAVESNVNDPEVIEGSQRYLSYTDGSTLFDHLSEEGEEHLRRITSEYGLNVDFLAEYNTYAVSSVFTVLAAMMGGFGMDGVDAKLLALAEETDLPILELEYYADLYLKLETLDDDTMERICILPLTGPVEMVADLEKLYQVFLTGDDETAIDYLFAEEESDIEYQDKDELYSQYMITDRNEVMADSIAEYLSRPGTVFVAAGLAHFLGEGSIIEQLETMGYTVTRL